MKILSSEQIRKVDALTIEQEPVDSIDLMERAAAGCYRWIKSCFGHCHRMKVFVGPGNNGGDGLAVARMFAEDDISVEVFMLTSTEKLSSDASANFKRLNNYTGVKLSFLEQEAHLPDITAHDLILDAMFGSGLTRPLTGLAADVVKHINQSGAMVVAIDIPSGLYCDENTYEDPEAIIKAVFTLTFQLPKLAFFFPENLIYTGEWFLIDIALVPDAIQQQESPYIYFEGQDIFDLLKPRKRFSHKGTFGHALLMAGSYGKMGAAVLSARACLRSGVGLLTAHIVSKGYDIVQTAIPEAIVSIDSGYDYLSSLPDISKYNAIGIGPGIGTNDYTGLMFYQLLQSVKVPIVLDADALNLLSIHREWMEVLPPLAILTPHPGEFDRLAGSSKNGYERFIKQKRFSSDHHVIVVLKGAYTSITTPEGMGWFNSSGNPGMATAGSGDALTGIILSLLAQGYHPLQAALAGVYLHGLAGDLVRDDIGEEALIASDIINYLGKAFISVKRLQS